MPYIGKKPADIIATAVDTTTGTFSGDIDASTVNATGDTAAGDNAAIGFTSAEGLILTGQGSTNDVTIKNDADADVIEIPTGTVNVTMAGTLGVIGAVTANAGVVVDEMTLDADTLTATDTFTIDAVGDITLDADGGDVYLKDGGTEFGRIGNAGGRLFVNNGDVGLNFAGDADQILPSSAGTNRDAAIDLGTTNVRFKDLYLSSGVFLGGAGAANELTDYEEGTWTPTASCTDGNGSLAYASNGQVGHYTKVGNMVNITCYLLLSSISGASGTFRIAAVPFTSKNVTNAYITGGLWINSTASDQIFDGNFNETVYLGPNDTTIKMFAKNGGGAYAQLDVSHLGAGSDFMVNITYRV